MLKTVLGRPIQSAHTLYRALRLGVQSESGLFRHVLYALEALVVADWMKGDGVQHVHAHFGTNSATVAMLAAQVAGGTFSFTVHGPEEFDKPALIHLPEKIERASFVAAISSYGISQLRRLSESNMWDKLKIVRCGVEPDFFAIEPSANRRPRHFVAIGRLAPQKGLMTLIEGAARLKAAGQSFTIRLIGDGPLRKEIEAAIASNGLDDFIELTGPATPDEVKTALSQSSVFVLPSYAEGLPVVIMEAFAQETPVITTYVAGIPELVEHGVNGWLTPASDADALAAAMAAALDTPTERLREMGQLGRERVAEQHAIDVEAAKLKTSFAVVLGEGDE